MLSDILSLLRDAVVSWASAGSPTLSDEDQGSVELGRAGLDCAGFQVGRMETPSREKDRWGKESAYSVSLVALFENCQG
jgi:hypothetical protein